MMTGPWRRWLKNWVRKRIMSFSATGQAGIKTFTGRRRVSLCQKMPGETGLILTRPGEEAREDGIIMMRIMDGPISGESR